MFSTHYDIQDAVITYAKLNNELDDFTGNYYIEKIEKEGSLSFSVCVPATGEYGIRLRFSNTSDIQNLDVYVDDIFNSTIEFPTTINENTWSWSLVALQLNEGVNTIRFVNTSSNCFNVNLDALSVSFFCKNENKGFLTKTNFTFNSPKADDYTLSIHYSAGNTDSAPQKVTVKINGVESEVLLASLRSMDCFNECLLNVSLVSGLNTIEIEKALDEAGEIIVDYLTLKPVSFTYIGDIEGLSGNNTSELTFQCTNTTVKIFSVAPNTVKIWLDNCHRFIRKYDSFSIINDNYSPESLCALEYDSYYQIEGTNFDIRISKYPFSITFYNKQGDIILENSTNGFAWSEDNEYEVNHKLSDSEHFWGLGEKLNSFDHLGHKNIMWAVDAYGNVNDASVPSFENGRWYMANPYYISSKGYSIFFDNASRTVFDFGNTDEKIASFGTYNPNPGGEFIYYFTYGPSVKSLISSYTTLTGKSFFAPKWAYGNIQCHYGYLQKDVERVAKTYRQKDIPIDVILSDIEWYEYLCTPTMWNKKNYPEPSKMISTLKDLHIRYGLINDPNITNRDNNTDFSEGNTKGFFVKDHSGKTRLICWPWGLDSGLTDFFNPEAAAWWGELLDEIINQGVSCMWLDMNEPAKYNTDWLFWNKPGKAYGTLSEVKNAYAIKHQEAVFKKMTQNHKRSFLQTRSGYSGTHRYASPWTGDIQGTYKSMGEQLRLGLSLSLSGYLYWGFDIGGFFTTITDEQYARWVELACFTPVHRFHYCEGVEEKEPWTHNATDVSKKYINLRYQLVPYMYSYTADSIIGIGMESDEVSKGTGLPLVRPLVMEYPNDTNVFSLETEFMCGESFLIAPVIDDSCKKEVYLPEGDWYDYFDPSSSIISGSQTIIYDAPTDVLPVFVKAGSIIPFQSTRKYMEDPDASNDITIKVYPSTSDDTFKFVLYEDDGQTLDYENKEYVTTCFNCDVTDNTNRISLAIEKTTYGSLHTPARNFNIVFHNIVSDKFVVCINGKETDNYSYNQATNTCLISIADSESNQIITINKKL